MGAFLDAHFAEIRDSLRSPCVPALTSGEPARAAVGRPHSRAHGTPSRPHRLRLPRPVLSRPLQPLQRIRDALMETRVHAAEQSSPPPGREREVSPVSQHAAAGVDGGARDPVIAENPEREGRAEPDLVQLSVNLQDLALDLQTPAQFPACERLAGRREARRLNLLHGQVPELAVPGRSIKRSQTNSTGARTRSAGQTLTSMFATSAQRRRPIRQPRRQVPSSPARCNVQTGCGQPSRHRWRRPWAKIARNAHDSNYLPAHPTPCLFFLR